MSLLLSLTAPVTDESIKAQVVQPREAMKMAYIKGAWTLEQDEKLAEVIAVHGAKKWNTIAAKAGLNRSGKSCRLRWLNYLRPNIKRGNISDQEEDLILRLHKLLGNRWSLIAGRLPGRTDNEIKNYWNSHLIKKINEKEKQTGNSTRESNCQKNRMVEKVPAEQRQDKSIKGGEDSKINFDVDEFFDFSKEEPAQNLEWINQFLELDEGLCDISQSV